MQLPRGSGLEYLDKVVRSSLNYYRDTFKTDNLKRAFSQPLPRMPSIELPSLDTLKKPVESFLKGLNSTVSQLTAPKEKTNYESIVSSFLPPGARLVKPQYPENANAIQFADLDGDKQNELVASYGTHEGLRTVVLKRDEVQWYKMAEISHPEFNGIHYRTSANIASEGKKYLLMGLTSEQKGRTLIAYALDDGSARKIFSRKYDKLELQKSRTSSRSAPQVSFALWNEEAPDIFDIEVVSWNGLELEQLDNRPYLTGKVVPYYVRKLRHNPNDTTSWYNLANAMSKSGNTANAATAINLGLERNPEAPLKERFMALKSRL